MRRELLTETQLKEALSRLEGWTVEDKALVKSVEFEDFAASLAYVNKVGALAEEADHHPDITFGWGYAHLSLTTHDRGGITDTDIALAEKLDRV